MNITTSIQRLYHSGRKGFAILLDPDNWDAAQTLEMVEKANHYAVDYLFVGGSLIQNDNIHQLVPLIKAHTNIPVILFPGSVYQLSPKADGVLFLSLISGRNPDLLIGKQVEAAPLIKQSGIEAIPTGYMLVDCGRPTTASYISGTLPIPYDKAAIAACTAMAGELLGLRLIYLDGGSGAAKAIDPGMVRKVRDAIDVPIVVGGGIREVKTAETLWEAGADLLVIGNAFEKDPGSSFVAELAACRESFATFTQNLRS